MTVAIVGSRSISADIPEGIITEKVTHIVSGAAVGIDRSARRFAKKHHIVITEVLPEYDLYGRSAPLRRNDCIIKYSDMVYVFWDGKSRGTVYVINQCRKLGKPCEVYLYKDEEFVPCSI